MDELSLNLSNLTGLAVDPTTTNNTDATHNNNPPLYTTPTLLHQSPHTSIYRHLDVGIKILSQPHLGDPQPSAHQIQQLHHELAVSQKLNSNGATKKSIARRCVKVANFKGRTALYFEWVNGITLTEWMNKVSIGSNGGQDFTPHAGSGNDGYNSYARRSNNSAIPKTDDLNVRLRAAMAIARTLAEFHEGGVSHGKVCPTNVVLDMVEGDYVATLIDLSEASILTTGNDGVGEGLGEKEKKRRKMEDLKALGGVLKQLFRGFDDANAAGTGAMQNSSFQLTAYGSGVTSNHGSNTSTITGITTLAPNQRYSNSTTTTSTALALTGGEEVPFETWGDETRRKRNKAPVTAEAGDGLPIYLGSLISTLLLTESEASSPSGSSSPQASSTVQYESAFDVYLDLKVMLENQNQFYRQTELDERMIRSRLLLPNVFYGRQVQMSMLMHLFHSVVMLGNSPSIATISGHPGTGKSTLVNQIKKTILEKDGCFIEGKFLKSTRPDTVLANALNNFFGSILGSSNSGNTMHMSLRWRIHDVIGSGNNVVLEAIPNLRKLMSEDRDSSNNALPKVGARSGRSAMLGSSHRLPFLFCKLIGAIACKAHPLILFLDDLQWADEMTLDVMRMIMTDPDVHHFLFIGTYRDNEVNLSHLLMEKLSDLREQGINVINISVGAIEKECVNTLISEALCLPPALARPLSNVVHSKTGGIIMFLLRFLKSLNDEGLLWFSLSARRWEFDLNKIRIKQISEDVVQHMTLTMTKLEKNMQMGLRTAACLGSNFDAEILRRVKKEDDFDMETFLEKCVEDGYLISIDDTKKFAWTHDQVHQAAYELIPIAQRESFHLLLGSRLLMESSSQEQGELLFYVVDNMNRGLKLLESSAQKYELSFLNLRAGERAISSSAFHSASRYFITGLSLLEHDSWDMHYNLTIGLYDAASEALYVTGDFSRLAALADKPLKFARTFEDKLNIYNNLVRSFLASGQLDQGIATCMRVLAQLGEALPAQLTQEVFHVEVLRVKTTLEGMSNEALLSLPIMTDTTKLATMQFLNHLLYQVYAAKPAMAPIIAFRMVEISIEHGVCNITPFAFGVYGAFLVSTAVSDTEGGYRMGRVATELMKRINAIEIIPRLYTTIYAMINIWKEPFQASLSKHLEAFDIGAHRGDMEFAISNLFQYVNMAIYGCGENFDGLVKNIHAYTKRAFQCQQNVAGKSLIVAHQLAFDFMGLEQNAYSLYFAGTTEQSCFETACQNKQTVICRYICLKRKHVAFWTGDMDAAAEMYELSKQFPLGSNARQVNVLVGTFIDGLIAFYFARKHRSDEAKWTAIGEDVMATLQKWEEGSTWNFRNKRLLLEAEYNFLKGDDQMTLNCYTASINAARAHRFYHEEGLAYEKAATFLLHKNNHDGALDCFMNAKKCYEAWGAHGIVGRVERAIAVLLPLCADS